MRRALSDIIFSSDLMRGRSDWSFFQVHETKESEPQGAGELRGKKTKHLSLPGRRCARQGASNGIAHHAVCRLGDNYHSRYIDRRWSPPLTCCLASARHLVARQRRRSLGSA